MEDFSEYIQILGFNEYPFSTFTTENEKGKEQHLFVHPSNYAPIIQNFQQHQSLILIGNRGTGKTAILSDFKRQTEINKTFLVEISDFSLLPLQFTQNQFYNFIIHNISERLIKQLPQESKRIKKLNKDDKILLSFLIFKFTNNITKNTAKQRIEEIQSEHIIIRGCRYLYNIIRHFFNYGISVATNFLDTYIARYLNIPIDTGAQKIRDIFPEISSTSVDMGFNKIPVNYEFLCSTFELLHKMQFDNITIIIDKLDEDSRLKNNGENIANFARTILTDNRLLLNQDVKIIISMWSTPFNHLKEEVRTQKHNCPQLEWLNADLKKALNKRLSYYSENRITDYNTLFDLTIDPQQKDTLFELANSNPRDLWHIFNELIKTQFHNNPDSKVFELSTINEALTKFITEFNYYEYYPRKINARANTMDIYSYIALLQRLPDYKFTKNQLNSYAKTGSSTSNYVVGMERIGLIEKDSQQQGAIIYRIKDPKVRYALKKGLKIEKP